MDITMLCESESAGPKKTWPVDPHVRPKAPLNIRIVEEFSDLSVRDRLAWGALDSQPTITVPFQSLFWCEMWWKQFGTSSRWGSKRLQILVMECDGEIVAFFPMLRQTVALGALQFLRVIQPLGGDNNLTELRTGIVRQGFERDAFAALTGYFQNHGDDWEVVSLPAGPEEVSDLYEAISVEHPTIPRIVGFSIPLTDDWTSFRSGLKRNIKESIRKCYNSFKRDGVDPQFVCLTDSASIRAILPEFYRLHSMRADQEGGIDHRDAFQSEYARRFLDLQASDTAASGFRLFLLKHGDRLIAARLGFETRFGTYLSYSGYDLDYGKYSVMTRLVIEVIRYEIEHGKKFIHLSFGRDVSKTRWSPDECVYKWNLMFQKSFRGKLAALAVISLMRLKHRG